MNKILKTIFTVSITAFLMLGFTHISAKAPDTSPATVQVIQTQIRGIQLDLAEIRMTLKNKEIRGQERRALKRERNLLKRELRYQKEMLRFARNPHRYAPRYGYQNVYRTVRRPVSVVRQPVYCPPTYQRNQTRTSAQSARTRTSTRTAPAPRPRPSVQRAPRRSNPVRIKSRTTTNSRLTESARRIKP